MAEVRLGMGETVMRVEGDQPFLRVLNWKVCGRGAAEI